MQTKTVRNILPPGRAVQAFVLVSLFAGTVPFADAVVSGTLSRLGVSVGGAELFPLLSMATIGTSASVSFCCLACWRSLQA
ncbi:hypothetical protein [Haladaptatus caseinilyticus]|uniref:hypothetical protein n=1 Tax=Haladaptatus caseinilyticus TaxID=2993314 RepID=UPI00224AEAE6|nr:hypothetical protein [Haladaptatus caseinilyticus]